MALKRDKVLEILYPSQAVRGRRYTQDSPILPDVWILYGKEPTSKQKLLLTPHIESSVQTLVSALKRRLARERGTKPEQISLPYTQSHVLVNVTFRELVRVVLPLSNWWKKHTGNTEESAGPKEYASRLRELANREDLDALLRDPAHQDTTGRFSEDILQLARIAGAIARQSRPGLKFKLRVPRGRRKEDAKRIAEEQKSVLTLAKILDDFDASDLADDPPPLWTVSVNRQAYTSIWRSRLAVKADAAVRVFDVRCRELRWAVIDSGIDAKHPAFAVCGTNGAKQAAAQAKKKNGEFESRVAKTYDFTRLIDIFEDPENAGEAKASHKSVFEDLDPARRDEIRRDLRYRMQKGLAVDWTLLEPFLQVPHDARYRGPVNQHGTHVAGILAGNWCNPKADEKAIRKQQVKSYAALRNGDLIGMCPDLELYDFRVFNDQGASDEFTILAALQFVRHLNAHKDTFLIPGVNLSFSLNHDVRNFACGRTPVCEECERLVGSGVVVVAAAGNRGFTDGPAELGGGENYRDISITDPGNTDSVITVGSTHRFMPHTYGVSYFSSRGPTGDGRSKPDLVAPGEKIRSTIPGEDAVTLDGTSMAAPHVSGAAALLMARNSELIGQPARIKQILCSSATDLGRERKFQGAGMLDVLRALQSV